MRGRNRRTNEEGLFPAGEFVKLIHSVSSVLRPKPVPKPRPPRHSRSSASSGYLSKSEINDSGYDGSPRGMVLFLTAVKIFEFSTMWNGWLEWMHCFCGKQQSQYARMTPPFAVNLSQNTHAFLANVNSSSRSLYVIGRPSVCLSSVCRL